MPCRPLFELVLPGLRTCWQQIVAIRLLGFDGSFEYIVDDFMSKPSNVMRNKFFYLQSELQLFPSFLLDRHGKLSRFGH